MKPMMATDTRRNVMKSIKFATVFAAVWIGSISVAAAQGRMQPRFVVDSLDPLLNAVPSLAMTLPTTQLLVPTIVAEPAPMATEVVAYAEVEHTDEQQAPVVRKGIDWNGVIRGLETGFDLTHQGLDAYEHYLDAKALGRYYRQQ